MKAIITQVLVIVAIASHAAATESGTLRCGGELVSIGDTAGELIAKCGEPAYRTQRQNKIVERDPVGDKTVTSITVDDWLFNFGPDYFQYQVLLENGRITRIDSLDYGY